MSVITLGANTTTSLGTQITAVVGTNTKGDYLEFEDSTTAACQGILLEVHCGGADADNLVDIATGAAASEVVLVGDIHCRSENAVDQQRWFFFPVSIAAGTRVALRYQSTSASATVHAILYLLNNTENVALQGLTPTTYGAATADSGGTGVDPGGTANTKGAYAEIEDSTADAIDWLLVMVGNRNNNAVTSATWLLDIATGAESSESDVISNISVHTRAEVDIHDAMALGPFPVAIAASTRLSARAQCTSNDATDRLLDVVLIGFSGTAMGSGGGGQHFSASFMG
jgi:hypothetical protein